LGHADETGGTFQENLSEAAEDCQLPKDGAAEKQAAIAEGDAGEAGGEDQKDAKKTGTKPTVGKEKLGGGNKATVVEPRHGNEPVQGGNQKLGVG